VSGTLITFIGAGNMADALIRGLLARGVRRPGEVLATDVSPERREAMAARHGIRTSADNAAACEGADWVVLAVKPQVLPDVLKALAGRLSPAARVLSIAAGIRTAKIEDALGGAPRVVRAMPNTPALVGRGASALCAGRHARPADLDEAERLLSAVGLVVRVGEDDMDAVTALSGSGPAYVFVLVEAMLAAAARMGLEPATARALTRATVAGAAELLAPDDADPSELRRRVTSKGGTTEAALRVLDDRHVLESIVQAIRRAQERSRELAR
jgi:pyrroline-5-carboxylate reductase